MATKIFFFNFLDSESIKNDITYLKEKANEAGLAYEDANCLKDLTKKFYSSIMVVFYGYGYDENIHVESSYISIKVFLDKIKNRLEKHQKLFVGIYQQNKSLKKIKWYIYSDEG